MGTKKEPAKDSRRKNKRPHKASNSEGSGAPSVKDSRFEAAEWDPRFGRVPKRAKKAIDDERFQEQLKSNPAFRQSSTRVDRFGRPKLKGPNLDKSLKEIAEESDESSSSSEDEDEILAQSLPRATHLEESSSDESELDDEAFLEGKEVEDIPRGSATSRLAVMGLDWSATRAVDIFASLESFCPPGKRIEYVEVHPSKFGLERLAVEAKLGPQVVAKTDLQVVEDAKKQELVSPSPKRDGPGEHDDLASDDDDEDSSEEGSDAAEDEDGMEEQEWKSQTALRKYEEERLKYYYGVVQFEDIKSADAVYEQCDGVEYAQSGRAFDLRFIPDDMKFETKPRDRADKVPEGYAPPNITPSALNNSRVKLTWDADDPDRVILKKKAIGKHELDEENLKAYLANSSDEDEDKTNADDIERKRKLLLGGLDAEEEEPEMEMEVTFEPGMLEKGEEIVKRKRDREDTKDETPWEARLRRQRERKVEKRQQWREAQANKDEDAEEDIGGADAAVDNPTFDSDPFFSIDRDMDEPEAGERRTRKKDKKKKKRDKQGDGDDATDDVTAEEQKRRQAELELLMMDDQGGSGGKKSKRAALVAAESDDEEERGSKRKGRRKRGRGREEQSEKGSAVDVGDERFQGVFDSHLYAMDPTHPKYRDNETTRGILREKAQRIGKRDRSGGEAGTDGGGRAEQSEAMQLVARIKAKAAAKRKAKAKRGAA